MRRRRRQAVSNTGTHLHALIKTYFRADFKAGCTCRATIDKMNANPPEWSLSHMRWITGRIRGEARKRRWGKLLMAIPGSSAPIRWLVLEAVRLASKPKEESK